MASSPPRLALFIESSRAHGQGLLRGIAKYAHLHGPWVFFRESPVYLDEAGSSATHQLRQWRPDAAVYWPHTRARSFALEETHHVERLLDLAVPTVMPAAMVRSASGPVIDIDSDISAICAMAIEHLTERGFHHLAWCGIDLSWSHRVGRYFCEQARRYNLPVHVFPEPATTSKYSRQQEECMLTDWLGGLPKPIGIMTCNDDRSQDVVEACKVVGIRIPQEVALVGVDNDEFLCELSDIPLSSIALNTEQAGYEAAEILDNVMHGRIDSRTRITIGPTLVVRRQSTDVLAIQDPTVAQALWFIHNSARHSIQVQDVAEAAAVSRRVLEKRFRRVVGRSVLEEIRRVRTGHIAELLVETDLSLVEIARRLDFSNIDAMYQYFRRSRGISLRQWRNRHRHT